MAPAGAGAFSHAGCAAWVRKVSERLQPSWLCTTLFQVQVAHWHRAHCAFTEVFAFNSAGVIETSAVVLPRDGGGQFHQLRIGEAFTKSDEERVGHFDRNSRHRVRILKNQSFQIREMEISPVVIQIGDFFFRNTTLSADGRADINSKRAADQSCNA